MAERKLDIFAVITATQNKDFNFYSNLAEVQRKEFAPVVIQRWLTGTSNALQTVLVNEYVNPYVFSLHNHPELLYKLMTVAAEPRSGRTTYPKTKPRSSKNKPIANEVVQRFYNATIREASEMVDTLHVNQILDAAYDLGYDEPTLKKLRKEII